MSGRWCRFASILSGNFSCFVGILWRGVGADSFCCSLPRRLVTRAPVRPHSGSHLLILGERDNRLLRGRFCSIVSCLGDNSYLILGSAHILPTQVFNAQLSAKDIIRFILLGRGRRGV